MQIDFNHVRKKAGETYNELIRFLTSNNYQGYISFDDTEIEEILFDLRCSIGAIMGTHEPDDEGFKALDEPMLMVFSPFEDVYLDEADYHAQ